MSFSNWKTDSLSNITALISRGITPKYTENVEESILVLNQRCVREGTVLFENARRNDLSKRKVRADKTIQSYDIFVNSTGVGTLGRVSQIGKVNELITVDSHVTIVRADTQKVDELFLGYAVKNNQTIIENMAEGSTGQTELSRKRLGDDLEINYPVNIEEQKAIAHILSTLDEKIEVNNQINKTLEKMAQAIFKQWFVDFEFPNEDGEPYQSSGGEMVESELGMIPKGWEVKLIGDLTEVVSKGTTPRKSDIDKATDQNVIKFLKVKDINNDGTIEYSKLEDIPKSVHENQLKRSILCSKDILLSIAGTIGRVSYVDEKLINANTNQAVAFVRLKDIEKYFFLIMYKFKSSQFQESINSKVVQGVQANISLTVVKNEKLVEPTIDILELYNNTVNSIFKQVEILNNQNCSLKDIRDTLLPKLMSGEIRVPLDSEGEAS